MPRFGPIKRKDLIRHLRRAGFEGPVPGGRHQAMRRDTVTVPIPNPHESDIGRELLKEILRQAGISRPEWERL
jgi:predicted RNA binding protein YcfA (HicA-like mRNA interferase family)